jgi:hypothetical protein
VSGTDARLLEYRWWGGAGQSQHEAHLAAVMGFMLEECPEPLFPGAIASGRLSVEPVRIVAMVVEKSLECLIDRDPSGLDRVERQIRYGVGHFPPGKRSSRKAGDDALVRLQQVPLHVSEGTIGGEGAERLVLRRDCLSDTAALVSRYSPACPERLDVHPMSLCQART